MGEISPLHACVMEFHCHRTCERSVTWYVSEEPKKHSRTSFMKVYLRILEKSPETIMQRNSFYRKNIAHTNLEKLYRFIWTKLQIEMFLVSICLGKRSRKVNLHLPCHTRKIFMKRIGLWSPKESQWKEMRHYLRQI